jgi:hypothetical protein
MSPSGRFKVPSGESVALPAGSGDTPGWLKVTTSLRTFPQLRVDQKEASISEYGNRLKVG